MTNHAVLNQVDHKDTRIITQRAEKYGDAVMSTMIFPFEFRNVQACYPILFQKDGDTGKFYPVALLGFENNENLFLVESDWCANYIPLNVLRQPFMVGFQSEKPILSIDMNNPRVNSSEGEALFLEQGEISPYLDEMTKILSEVHKGYQNSQKFIEAILEFELLEPLTLNITLADGSSNQLLGFYTINEAKLRELSGETLAKLNSKGFLQPVFMAVASIAQLTTMINLKNQQISC